MEFIRRTIGFLPIINEMSLVFMNGLSLIYREKLISTDIEVIRKLIESVGVFSPEENDIAVELAQISLIKGSTSGYHFLFAKLPDNIVGYTCFGPIAGTMASFDLYWIVVHQNFRGLGIGKKLLAGTESMIAKRGGRRIYIETSSRKQYEPVRSFYSGCGYCEEAILNDFYSPGDNKVIYVKAIHAGK
jgi:D-alanine-D-alanine ligase